MQARSYVHGASPVPLLGETIFENFRRTAARCGDKDALIVRSQGKRFTWGSCSSRRASARAG